MTCDLTCTLWPTITISKHTKAVSDVDFTLFDEPCNRVLGRIEAYQRAQAKASAALRRELRAALLRERRAVLDGVAALLHSGGPHDLPTQLQLYQVGFPKESRTWDMCKIT
jgi:hypothetical protein